MIGLIFSFGTETIEVKIEKPNIFFRTSQFQQFGDIDGIKLNKQGVIKEFPDLKDNKDWEKITRERFKKKVKTMKTEKEIVDYVIKELTKYGYKILYSQEKGFRVKKYG